MDFELSEEQRLLRDNARAFLDKEIVPLATEYDSQSPLPKAVVQEHLRMLKPLGYLDGLLSEDIGGGGLSVFTYGLLMEELGRAWAGLAGTMMIQASMTRGVANAATPALRERLLPALTNADKIICMGITEPNAGSNSASIQTTAVPDGDEYVVNGTKIWISNAPVSDVAIVVCVTDKNKGSRGISRIVIERDKSPYQSRDLHKLGLRAFPTGELVFQDCRVPRENLFGAEGLGYKLTLQEFEVARTYLGMISAGICQAALEASITYVRERRQFGKPIGAFQMVQSMIVDMYADTECARFLSYKAAAQIDKGVRASTESSLAKAFATEAAVRVASKGVQIHGGMGLSDEYPMERYFRDARSLTIPDGTTEIQKLIVGRDILGISAIY